MSMSMTTYLLSTYILQSLSAQWAARVRHLCLSVATARTLFQSTPLSTRSSLDVFCEWCRWPDSQKSGKGV